MMPLYSTNDPYAWLLAAVVFLPLLTGLILLILPPNLGHRRYNFIGLLVLTLTMLGGLSLYIYTLTNPSTGWAFLSTTPLGLQAIGAQLQLGLNSLSLPFFFLTLIVSLAAGIFAVYQSSVRSHLLWSFILLTTGGTLGAFASVDLFYSFLFHEIALLPTLLSLMVFGGAQRRQAFIQVGSFMLVGSLIFLVALIAFKHMAGIPSFSAIHWQAQLQGVGAFAPLVPFIFIILGAAILSGLWPFYSWVPRLLTQAPTPIAMIQGGVLKFFALYFILQAFWPSLSGILAQSQSLQLVLSVLGAATILLVGFSALRQTQLSGLAAYAAVMHMGTLFLALNAASVTSVGGAVTLIFGSGLATALLLMLSGVLAMQTGGSRFTDFSGLRSLVPQFSWFLVIALMATVAIPCFINFLGELSVIIGIIQAGHLSFIAILIGLIIAASFGLNALRQMLFGSSAPLNFTDLSPALSSAAWLLSVPLILFALFPAALIQPLHHWLSQFFSL